MAYKDKGARGPSANSPWGDEAPQAKEARDRDKGTHFGPYPTPAPPAGDAAKTYVPTQRMNPVSGEISPI